MHAKALQSHFSEGGAGRMCDKLAMMPSLFTSPIAGVATMSFSMYSASVPVFKQMLNSLLAVLNKAEAHVEAKKLDPNAFLQFRLYPDMLPFVRQVQIAADFAKGAGCRLAGQEVPSYEDTEKTFPELKLRIVKTLSLLDNLPQSDIEGS